MKHSKLPWVPALIMLWGGIALFISSCSATESEQIVETMKKKGIEYEYMLFPDEGHGFAKPENRLKFYAGGTRKVARNLLGKILSRRTPEGITKGRIVELEEILTGEII